MRCGFYVKTYSFVLSLSPSSFSDDRDMLMLEEQSMNGNNYVSPFTHQSMFFSTHQPSPMNAGGPERLKFQSYRSSPYNYSQNQRKSSPTDGKIYNHFRFLFFYLLK